MQVEDEYRVEGMPVHWYVVSDCPSLRYKAAEEYGPKVHRFMVRRLLCFFKSCSESVTVYCIAAMD